MKIIRFDKLREHVKSENDMFTLRYLDSMAEETIMNYPVEQLILMARVLTQSKVSPSDLVEALEGIRTGYEVGMKIALGETERNYQRIIKEMGDNAIWTEKK